MIRWRNGNGARRILDDRTSIDRRAAAMTRAKLADLPVAGAQARRFDAARRARSAALGEDYVELIADLIAVEGEARAVDLARRLGVSHAAVIKSVNRLKREDLVSAKPYRGIFLTEAGQALADRVRTRHRLVVELLLAVGVPPDDAERDAEGLEHHVSENTLAAFSRFLANRQ